MNQTDPSAGTEQDATVDTAKSGREYISKGAPSLKRGVESGAVTATIGAAGLFSGLRRLLAGKRKHGLIRLALGIGFLAVALLQRRSHNRSGESAVEEPASVDNGSDADASAGEPAGVDEESGVETGGDSEAESTPIDHREIADNGVDSGDLAEAAQSGSGAVSDAEGTSDEAPDERSTGVGDGIEDEEIERLGEAALDRQSRKVPAPQQAFNRGFLSHSSMVCWGIRERDDAVLIALDYDAIQGREGVTYVASSEIGTDVREVPIPDAILDHWDEVIGGGTAVSGGDDILFVTSESLATDGLLCVLPAAWADGLSE